MDRTVTPQCKGIYYNKDVEESEPYPFLMLKEDDTYEHFSTDAFECDKDGNINPEKPTSLPKFAKSFGDFAFPINPYEDIF